MALSSNRRTCDRVRKFMVSRVKQVVLWATHDLAYSIFASNWLIRSCSCSINRC